MVIWIPRCSTVPPLFIPAMASTPPGRRRPIHRHSSWMPGQNGSSRVAIAAASPKWSPWPCVTSSTSQAATASAFFGLRGLPNHGSNRIVSPPGRPDLEAGMPEPRDRRVGVERHQRTSRGPYRRSAGPPGQSPVHFRPPCRLLSRSPRTSPSSTGPSSPASRSGRSRPSSSLAPATEATRGYLAFTAFCAAAFAALAWLADGALPATPQRGTAEQRRIPSCERARRLAPLLLAVDAVACGRRGAGAAAVRPSSRSPASLPAGGARGRGGRLGAAGLVGAVPLLVAARGACRPRPAASSRRWSSATGTW